jgi:hypothetical protein
MSVNALVSQTIENQQATRQDFPCYCSFAYSPLTPYQAKRQRFYRLFIMVASVSRNPSLFPSPIYVSDLGVVTFEHLLDALDRAVQLADQIFIGSGEQIGKKSVNLLSNLSILLATSPYLKQIFPITTVRLNVEENQLVNVFSEFCVCVGSLKSAQNGRFLEKCDAQNL